MAGQDLEWLTLEQAPDWSYITADGDPLERLDGFGKVNIFVGPNNGGKSRLMRSIARQKSYSMG